MYLPTPTNQQPKVNVYKYIYIYVYMHVCMYIYIFRHIVIQPCSHIATEPYFFVLYVYMHAYSDSHVVI